MSQVLGFSERVLAFKQFLLLFFFYKMEWRGILLAVQRSGLSSQKSVLLFIFLLIYR